MTDKDMRYTLAVIIISFYTLAAIGIAITLLVQFPWLLVLFVILATPFAIIWSIGELNK